MFTPNYGKPEESLHTMSNSNVHLHVHAFNIIHSDHLALASRSNEYKNRYIFLISESFTKYRKLYTTRIIITLNLITISGYFTFLTESALDFGRKYIRYPVDRGYVIEPRIISIEYLITTVTCQIP